MKQLKQKLIGVTNAAITESLIIRKKKKSGCVIAALSELLQRVDVRNAAINTFMDN